MELNDEAILANEDTLPSKLSVVFSLEIFFI